MLYAAYFMLWALIFLLGSVIFSFLNVLIYRLPKGISPAKGRSFCPACTHMLTVPDLVPVFSFLVLKGRCRYCGAKISPRYPVVETAGGVAALVLYAVEGLSVGALVLLGVAAILTTISFIDQETMLIPDSLVIALIPFAVASIWVFPEVSVISRAIGLLSVSLPMLILVRFIPDCFGGGDIKLIAVCGFFLGWQQTLVAFFVSLVFGGAKGIWMLTRDRTAGKSHFAFGPFLCAGIMFAALWGERILEWYLNFY